MKLMEYTGKIVELRGRMALARPAVSQDFPIHKFNLETCVMAQFNETTWYNSRPLHRGWHPFSVRDFLEAKNGKQVF